MPGTNVTGHRTSLRPHVPPPRQRERLPFPAAGLRLGLFLGPLSVQAAGLPGALGVALGHGFLVQGDHGLQLVFDVGVPFFDLRQLLELVDDELVLGQA